MKKLLLLLFLPFVLFPQVKGKRTQDGPTNYCSSATGNDTYACSLSPAITAYAAGNCYFVKVDTANTGTASINLNSLGAKTIVKPDGGVTTVLADNDIRANQIVMLCYDGTNMQLESNLGNEGSGGGAAPTVNIDWWPLGRYQGEIQTTVSGSPNQGVCHQFNLPFKGKWSYVTFYVITASGTGCTGGTCGFSVGVYDMTKTLVGYTEVGTSSHGTTTKNINVGGVKQLAWSGGTAVSGGQLTLDNGDYYLCTSSDSNNILTLDGWANQQWLFVGNGISGTPDRHGYKASLTTGNGGSLAWVSSWSGGLTLSGNGAETAMVMFTK